MSPARRVVLADAAGLAERVAADLLDLLAAGDRSTPVHVALTGGSIAVAIHREAARQAAGGEVDWSRVVVWWGDERFVEPDSPDRNALEARADFLDPVGVPAQQIHEIPSSLEALDVHAAAAAYARRLQDHGAEVLDLVMLGVGPDGHVASLFPGHPALRVEGAATAGVTGSPKPPPERVTLTLHTLNAARRVWFVVSGGSKASAVARAWQEESLPVDADDQRLPAARVHGRDDTVWYVDQAAAGSAG